jgi:hypothetical protein
MRRRHEVEIKQPAAATARKIRPVAPLHFPACRPWLMSSFWQRRNAGCSRKKKRARTAATHQRPFLAEMRSVIATTARRPMPQKPNPRRAIHPANDATQIAGGKFGGCCSARSRNCAAETVGMAPQRRGGK